MSLSASLEKFKFDLFLCYLCHFIVGFCSDTVAEAYPNWLLLVVVCNVAIFNPSYFINVGFGLITFCIVRNVLYAYELSPSSSTRSLLSSIILLYSCLFYSFALHLFDLSTFRFDSFFFFFSAPPLFFSFSCISRTYHLPLRIHLHHCACMFYMFVGFNFIQIHKISPYRCSCSRENHALDGCSSYINE